jgi:hypothetical protein
LFIGPFEAVRLWRIRRYESALLLPRRAGLARDHRGEIDVGGYPALRA